MLLRVKCSTERENRYERVFTDSRVVRPVKETLEARTVPAKVAASSSRVL
jgi:hypothetical protein